MSDRLTAFAASPATAADTSITPSPERPAVRTVFAGGELLIDGVAVCPACLEDKGSRFCRCTADDTLVDLDVASLRHVRAVGLAVTR